MIDSNISVKTLDNLMKSICHIYTNHSVRDNATTFVEIQYSPSTSKTSKEDFQTQLITITHERASTLKSVVKST